MGNQSTQDLERQYLAARQACAKNPNGKNRRLVDSLQNRLIRRQRRTLIRNYEARHKSGQEKVRAAEKIAKLAKEGAPAEMAETTSTPDWNSAAPDTKAETPAKPAGGS